MNALVLTALQPVCDEFNFSFTVRRGFSVFAHTHKNDLVDCNDGLPRHHIPHFTVQGDRGMSKISRFNTDLDDVALFRGAYEIDFGDIFGHAAWCFELNDCV